MAKQNKNQQKTAEEKTLPSLPSRKAGKVIYPNLEDNERLTSAEQDDQPRTIYRKLTDLKKLPNNPRYIKDQDFERLCKSIKDNPDYFLARPLILSDRTGELVIIAGNQRYEAALFNQLPEAPTFLMKGLTEQREKEIIIRDNVNNGNWDFELLANEWNDVDLQDWGIGFDDGKKTVSFDVSLNQFDESANTYLNNTVRQIMLVYNVETHKKVLDKLIAIGKKFNIEEDNSSVVLKLIELYENDQPSNN